MGTVLTMDKKEIREQHHNDAVNEHDRMHWLTFVGWIVYLSSVVGYIVYRICK